MTLLPTFASRGELAPLLNKIHHCDALELLSRLPDASVDCVLCDLPYEVLENSWDSIIPFAPLWEQLRRVIKKRSAVVLTATEPFASHLRLSAIDLYKYDWVWQKDRPSDIFQAKNKPLNEHEMVLIFSRGTIANGSKRLMNYYPQGIEKANIKVNTKASFSGGGIKRRQSWNEIHVVEQTNYPRTLLQFAKDVPATHPTQKPVALFEYLIKTYTQAGDVVLDMCVGSGTTAIAARNLGRSFICGDSHLPYVEMARLRLQNTDPFLPTVFKTGEKQLSLFSA